LASEDETLATMSRTRATEATPTDEAAASAMPFQRTTRMLDPCVSSYSAQCTLRGGYKSSRETSRIDRIDRFLLPLNALLLRQLYHAIFTSYYSASSLMIFPFPVSVFAPVTASFRGGSSAG
jgi:hypothetical protein